MIIPINISFRECRIGEIPINSSSKIIICSQCPSGSYSLIDPNINTEKVNLQCKKCP